MKRLVCGALYLVGAYVLFGAATDELAGFFGELFAESVISLGNEGTENGA